MCRYVRSRNPKNVVMAHVGQQHHKKKIYTYSIDNKNRISNCCMYFSLLGKQIIFIVSKFVW